MSIESTGRTGGSVKSECGRVRRVLWPDAGPRVATSEVDAARVHTAGCQACQAFFAEMAAWREALHDAAPSVAPLEVRDRLFQSVAGARVESTAGTHSRWRAHGGLGAVGLIVVLALAVGGIWVSRRDARRDSAALVAAVVEDHARAMAGDNVRSGEAADVSRWLATRLPFAVYVPVFGEARLLGARLCLMDLRRGAVIEYELGGEAVSYFVLPVESRLRGTPEQRLARATHNGYHVVYWRDAGLVHALAGRLPAPRLERLAKLCIEQGRALMALAASALHMPTRGEV